MINIDQPSINYVYSEMMTIMDNPDTSNIENNRWPAI